MRRSFIITFIFISSLGYSKTRFQSFPFFSDSLTLSTGKLKFVILCFKLSPPYDNEVAALNKLSLEYSKYVAPVVIKDDDLNKYKELFTPNEFRSLQDFILNKNQSQKNATSFPVILILDKTGKVKNVWSGDKTDDGLKKDEFYDKIKAGLESISKEH
jgi:hypothetical protein